MPIVKLQPEHLALCEQFASDAMRDQTPRSRAVAFRGNITPEVWFNGKACEVATALYFALDVMKAVQWDTKRGGDENDLIASGRTIDVKGTPNPKAVLLCYSLEITHLYLGKNFDTLLFSRHCPLPHIELVGWISKKDFYRLKYEAPDGPYGNKLDKGTWYVHRDLLHPIDSLCSPRSPAQIAIDKQFVFEFITGRT